MKEAIVFTIIMIAVWLLLYTVVNAVEMTSRVEPNVCNQNLDIIKSCCSGIK